jgi:flagellar hook-length control protein FliK
MSSVVTFEVNATPTSGTLTNIGTSSVAIGSEVAIGIDSYTVVQGSAPGPMAPFSGAPPSPASLPPNAPNLAAHQIAAALQENGIDPGHPIEIALDPPELGRVRLHMVELAGVLTLTIQAERPETAELMRRHLDLLAQEFSEAGVDAPSVRVSQDGSDGNAERENTSEQANLVSDDASDEAASMTTPTPDRSGALDLRL